MSKLPVILDLLTSLEEFLHPNHFLIMKLKQKWVTMAAKSEKNDKDTLRNIINFISDNIKNNHKDRSWSHLNSRSKP